MPTDPETRREGAHFLAPAAARRIVALAGLRPGEAVLDAGAGLGALTEPLAEAVGPAGKVVAVEARPDRAQALRRRAQAWPNVQVVQGDILAVRLPRLDAAVSNPPFRILPAILRRLLEHGCGRLVLVAPLELAERLTALPGGPAYGRLTVETGLRAKAKVVARLRRSDFEPWPEVQSVLLRLDPKDPIARPDQQTLAAVLDAAWSRKDATLRHSLAPLANTLGLPPQAVTDAIAWVKGEGRTAADLSPYEFGVLAVSLASARRR